MKEALFQLMRFAIVGSANTLLDILVYIGLTRSIAFFAQHYLLAAAVSFFIAGLNSFVWNKHWTFRDRLKFRHTQLVKFYLVAGGALLLNQWILWWLVSEGVYDIPAKLIASVSAGVIHFLCQKFWTFSMRRV